MSKADKQLTDYIRGCLDKGFSFKRIQNSLIERGYPKKVAVGIVLKYKHKGNIFKWFAVGSIGIILMFSIFLGSSGIIGMVTVGFSQSFIDEVKITAEENSEFSWVVPYDGDIVSIAISGNYINGIKAKIFIQDYLIFDSTVKDYRITDVSSKSLGNVIHFERMCMDTCYLEGFNKTLYNVKIELQEGVLELEEIHFDLRTNKPIGDLPEFTKIPNLEVGMKGRYINLSSFLNTTRERLFSYLGEDIDISIDGDLAFIQPKEVGKSHVFFIANVEGLEFVSNLIEINAVQEASDSTIMGQVKRITETKEQSNFLLILLILLTIAAIVIVLLIPKENIYKLAFKLDRLRKTDIRTDLRDYEIKKKQYRKSHDEHTLKDMETRVKKLAKKIPKNQLMLSFNEISNKFEKTRSKKKKQEHYNELRQIYLKLIEARLRKEDKEALFHKMKDYYKKIS